MSTPLLQVRDLWVAYGSGRRRTEVVHGVSFSIRAGTTVGLVGESGSGKSTIGRAIAGLVRPSAGSILLDGEDVACDRGRVDRRIAATRQVVFQDPYSSLNPALKILDALLEPLRSLGWRRADAERRVAEVIRRVGLPPGTVDRYPGGFSGGQRQRIAIARALVVEPKFIICDEAVSALDLSIQAQVLNLLRELQDEKGLSYLFIGHNLDAVRFIAQDFVVLNRGEVVETGTSEEIMNAPREPYTQRLVSAILSPDPVEQRRRRAHRLASAVADSIEE